MRKNREWKRRGGKAFPCQPGKTGLARIDFTSGSFANFYVIGIGQHGKNSTAHAAVVGPMKM